MNIKKETLTQDNVDAGLLRNLVDNHEMNNKPHQAYLLGVGGILQLLTQITNTPEQMANLVRNFVITYDAYNRDFEQAIQNYVNQLPDSSSSDQS
jgi:hypothetical protein